MVLHEEPPHRVATIQMQCHIRGHSHLVMHIPVVWMVEVTPRRTIPTVGPSWCPEVTQELTLALVDAHVVLLVS